MCRMGMGADGAGLDGLMGAGHIRLNGHGGLIIYKVVGVERGEKAYKRRKKINSRRKKGK